MCENIQNCCRICLDVESNHVSILEDPTINLHIKSCLAITVSPNDELPKVVCVSCVTQLSEFYNFQLNARCSQDWLESCVQEEVKKTTETKCTVQPLPDSEYNSDSLLEFLNNTANIEEYLNNLGKEDIPSIVNMLDRNTENSMDAANKIVNNMKATKLPSPKKKESTITNIKKQINMEIDVLDSEVEIVKELLMKESDPKTKVNQTKTVDKTSYTCFGCKAKFDGIPKLSQHLSTCDNASRTCLYCSALFDSKQQMLQHRITHNTSLPLTCNCGEQFHHKDKLIQHCKTCHFDVTTSMGCSYRCKQCDVTLEDRFQLYRHAKEHVTKSQERICDICGHTFVGNEALSKHRKEVHEKADNLLYRCKICNLTSANRKDIYMHIQKHMLKKELNRHLCESCGRSFATHATLMRHLSQHGKFSGHKCGICNKCFADVKSRDDHLSKHTELSICERCGQTVNSYKLDAHFCI